MLGDRGLARSQFFHQFAYCFIPRAEGDQDVAPGCLSYDGKYVVSHHALHPSDIYADWHPCFVVMRRVSL
ncbi:hypothetical protein PJL18_00692 [Paenarthrobacter nicotinovorans]|nr:hypothetical protein [Paenarthrobacter nicotinovorans]